MSYSPKSQKDYNDKCYRFSIKFVPSETEETARFRKYLTDTNQSANSYIKELIKADLDRKEIPYPESVNNMDVWALFAV